MWFLLQCCYTQLMSSTVKLNDKKKKNQQNVLLERLLNSVLCFCFGNALQSDFWLFLFWGYNLICSDQGKHLMQHSY